METLLINHPSYMSEMRFAALRTDKFGLIKVGKKTLNYTEKICISYQFRVDVQTYGHRPRYTAENEAA